LRESRHGDAGSLRVLENARGRSQSLRHSPEVAGVRRPNLQVRTRVRATKIVVEGGRAAAIEYVRGGKAHRVWAKKEIILSAGVYNSARLLLLSGIGPADDLRAVGIEPVLDLPGVGTNIADHASVMIGYATKEPITPLRQLRLDRAGLNFLRWMAFGNGQFATQPLSAQGLVRTLPDLDRPDVQFFFNPLRRDAKIFVPGISHKQEHVIEAAVVLLHPHSRGTLKLKSADPSAPPSVRLNLMSDPRDMEVMIRGLKVAREIYQTEPLRSLIQRETAPGPEVATDDEIRAFIRRTLYTVRHPVGSCRMGTDPMAVVDPQLRVRGIAGLRIADASVMPRIPGGNTNAPTIMIGEKAADLIRGLPSVPRA